MLNKRKQRGFIEAIGTIGKIGGIFGGLFGSKRDINKEKAIANSYKRLNYFKQQKADWVDIFGNIENNIAKYFNNLNADDFAAEGVAAQQEEFNKAELEIKTDLARRGIKDSGISDSILANLNFQNATAKATIEATADDEVAKQQSGFYQLGLQEKLNTQNQIGASYDSITTAHLSEPNSSNSNRNVLPGIVGAAVGQFNGLFSNKGNISPGEDG